LRGDIKNISLRVTRNLIFQYIIVLLVLGIIVSSNLQSISLPEVLDCITDRLHIYVKGFGEGF